MNKSKDKGTRFERECVDRCSTMMKSKRCWGSDGRSMGFSKEVDIVAGDYKIQCKVRKRIAQWLKIPNGCDAVMVKEDRGQIYVIMELDRWLDNVRTP